MPSHIPRKTFFYGWWVVIACAVIQFYLGGTFFQGFSALFNPIAEEFKWSYALVSLAFTFRGFESGIMAPIVGILVDKFGPRKILLCGVIITGLGFWLFGKINALWNFYGAFLFLALGLSLGTGVVTMAAVAHWFKERSGLAMGILTSGFGASGLLMPVVVRLVDGLGWRDAMVIFAAGTGIICLPLAFIVKDPPEEHREDDTLQNVQSVHSVKQSDNGLTSKTIMKSKDFWLLSTAVLFGGLAGQALIVHQIPYLVSVGISRQTAGFLSIVFALSNIVGRLLFGWLGDVMEKRRCFAISALIKAGGVLGFALANSVGQFIPSMVALGIGFGGLIPLRPALQIEFFGTRGFATIQGLLMIAVTVGTIVSPVFAGWMFDVIHNYRPAFITLAAATLIVVPLILATHRKLREQN
jgi:MFS family permease